MTSGTLWLCKCGHICFSKFDDLTSTKLEIRNYTCLPHQLDIAMCCACDGRYEEMCEVHRNLNK